MVKLLKRAAFVPTINKWRPADFQSGMIPSWSPRETTIISLTRHLRDGLMMQLIDGKIQGGDKIVVTVEIERKSRHTSTGKGNRPGGQNGKRQL